MLDNVGNLAKTVAPLISKKEVVTGMGDKAQKAKVK